MRIEEIKVYAFEELSDKAKEVALTQLGNEYWEGRDMNDYIVDNCYLFEVEKTKNFKIEDYNQEMLFTNNRTNIYWDNDYLECSEAIAYTDALAFYNWLQFDKKLINKIISNGIEIEFVKNRLSRSNTCIDLSIGESATKKLFTKKQISTIVRGFHKFYYHMETLRKRFAEEEIYLTSEEFFIDSDIVTEYEYLENGKIFRA